MLLAFQLPVTRDWLWGGASAVFFAAPKLDAAGTAQCVGHNTTHYSLGIRWGGRHVICSVGRRRALVPGLKDGGFRATTYNRGATMYHTLIQTTLRYEITVKCVCVCLDV
jgi:hypothetical protein